MPVLSSDDDPACRETVFRKLLEAMRYDTEGQRDLIGVRALDETRAVYWKDNQRPAYPPALPDQCSAD